MNELKIIDLTPENIAEYGVCGYLDQKKNPGFVKKIAWYKKQYELGLRNKTLITPEGKNIGMVEFGPGELANRPVNASGYTFINCIFVNVKKDMKGHGFGSMLMNACIEAARESGSKGVASVTRKGSFMSGKDIFIKHGFEIVDNVKPDFSLLALRFDGDSPSPTFQHEKFEVPAKYSQGLFILRSSQCPYTEKNVMEIVKTASNDFGIEATLVDLDTAEAAQNNPSPYGSFCIILNAEIVTHHPISKGRFSNIMNKRK